MSLDSQATRVKLPYDCLPGVIMGSMNALASREPAHWLEDLAWHQQAFRCSRIQWGAEEVHSLALRWTRGRLVYETPADLTTLCSQQLALRYHAGPIEDAMVPDLAKARREHPGGWAQGLAMLGLSDTDVQGFRIRRPRTPVVTSDVQRLARLSLPFPNPLIIVWEACQLRRLYQAADDLIEDTICDLVLELEPRHGLETLAPLTATSRSVGQLTKRLAAQRAARGGPGDRRRTPSQNPDLAPSSTLRAP